MSRNPGKKGGKGPSKKIHLPQVTERIKSTYQQVTNTSPFFVKRMTFRISVCQGCHGGLRSDDGSISLQCCIARKEKRTFIDVKSGKKRTSSTPCDTHYHIKLCCLPNEFDVNFLSFPEDLSEGQKDFLKRTLRTQVYYIILILL